MKTLLNMSLSEIYLDYFNNFISIDHMAEYYQVEPEFMKQLIELSRNLYSNVYDANIIFNI